MQAFCAARPAPLHMVGSSQPLKPPGVKIDWCAVMVLQLKGLLMAIYFGADHVVWAGQAGLISDKQILERYYSCPKHGMMLTKSPIAVCSLLHNCQCGLPLCRFLWL
jgi:hypothetical protein